MQGTKGTKGTCDRRTRIPAHLPTSKFGVRRWAFDVRSDLTPTTQSPFFAFLACSELACPEPVEVVKGRPPVRLYLRRKIVGPAESDKAGRKQVRVATKCGRKCALKCRDEGSGAHDS